MRVCSVINCNSARDNNTSLFAVKSEWLILNPYGWKEHHNKFICRLHFPKKDVVIGPMSRVLKRKAIPTIWLETYTMLPAETSRPPYIRPPYTRVPAEMCCTRPPAEVLEINGLDSIENRWIIAEDGVANLTYVQTGLMWSYKTQLKWLTCLKQLIIIRILVINHLIAA